MTMRKKISVTVASCLIFVEIFAVFLSVPEARRTIPGRIIRWCFGEPGATQGVNDAADIIQSQGWEPDLIELSESMLTEYRVLTTKSLSVRKISDRIYVVANES